MKHHGCLKLDEQVFISFLNRTKRDKQSKHIWNDKSLKKWTSYASKSIAQILHKPPFSLESSCKGHPDSNWRKEYLTIDVCAHRNSWAPLEIAIEIENSYRRIRYSAWKLFALNCEYRMLFAYYYPESSSSYFAKSQQQIIDRLQPVAKENSKKRLFLVCGNWNHISETDTWEKTLSTFVLIA